MRMNLLSGKFLNDFILKGLMNIDKLTQNKKWLSGREPNFLLEAPLNKVLTFIPTEAPTEVPKFSSLDNFHKFFMK